MSDPFTYGAARVVVNGVDFEASNVQVTGLTGLPVITSSYVPPGKAYILNPSALPPVEFTQEFRDRNLFDSLLRDYRAQFAYRINLGDGTTLERDPLSRPIPHTFRGVLRLMRDVFGYEWRKATDRPRRVPSERSLRGHAVITGITA